MIHIASTSDLHSRLQQPASSSAFGASGAAIGRSEDRKPIIKTVPDEHLRLTFEQEKIQALQALERDVTRIRHGEIHLVSSDALNSRATTNSRQTGYQLVKPGIPGHGLILHYAQLHSVEIPGLLGKSDAPYQPSAALQANIRRCQRKIFDTLLISEIKHVFSEGLAETLVPDSYKTGSELAGYRDQIRNRFKGYQPGGAMTPKQEEIFYACGALIYGYFAKGVTLHPTTNPSHAAKMDAYYANPANRERLVANKFATPAADKPLVFTQAEQGAMAEIKRVMQGKSLTVALTFGRDHKPESFTGNFDAKDFSPAVYSRDMTE